MKNIFFFDHDILAKTSVNVMHDSAYSNNDKFKSLFTSKKVLLEKYKGSTTVSNSIDYFLAGLTSQNLEKQAKAKKQDIQKEIVHRVKNTASVGAKKIKTNSNVFIHSVNNQVFEVLAKASKYKEFTVTLLEHNPLAMGEKASKILKKQKIVHKIYPDLAAENAIEHADICLIGADAILSNRGAIAKSGSKIVADIAAQHHCPVYVCAHSFRYDSKNTARHLLDHEHNNTKVYEALPKEKISSFITDTGIYKPDHIVEEIRHFNKWMFL